MANTLATSVLLLIAVCGAPVEAQNESSAPVAEPQYIGSFYALEASGKLLDLERTTVTFHAKSKVLPGYASIKMTTQFKPAHSPVRLGAGAQFIVRGRAPIDPVSRYELRLLKTSKDHREFVMTTAHGSVFGGSATSSLEEGAVSIRFEEYGANSYRVTSAQPLAPGEYALALRGMVSELYCFGVD